MYFLVFVTCCKILRNLHSISLNGRRVVKSCVYTPGHSRRSVSSIFLPAGKLRPTFSSSFTSDKRLVTEHAEFSVGLCCDD
uniref:Uncharacterized protein n=1 Tax=Anguilla anguilla TaxID=7936 RepID=A0A0E9VPL5_ANGAN